jgi:hypothetical protein
MGDLLSFPKKPERPDDWPWSELRPIVESLVSESAAERMKGDTLRMIDRAQEVSSGICEEGTRAALVELVAEVLVDRIMAERKFERRQA